MAFINDKEVFFSPHLHVSEVANVRTYSDVEIYNRHDIVSYNGSLYTPTVDSVTGKSPTDTEFWEDLASSKVNREELGATLSDLEAEVDVAKEEITRLEKENEIFEKRITNLEGATLKFTEDSSSAYEKIVPTDAERYAVVNKVGGMTYKSNNKIPYPFNTYAIENGVTFTANSDGSVTINGKSNGTNNNVFYLHKTQTPITIKAGTYSNGGDIHVTLYDNVNSKYYSFEKGKSLVLDKDVTGGLYIQITSYDTTEYKNFVVHPMLNEGSTALPYEPYFEGLRDTKVTELVSEGANLIPFPYISTSGTYNGVTFTIFKDGSVQVKGTATAETYFQLCRIDFGAESCFSEGTKNGLFFKDCSYNASNKANCITVLNGKTVDKIYYPMVNRGTTAAPYKPYRGTIETFPISAQLRSYLEQHGYGRGVEGYEGYIDLDNKVFIPPQSHRVVLDGTENWLLASTASSTGGLKRMQFTLPYTSVFESNYKTVPSICNLYNVGSGDDTWNGVVCASITNGERLHIFDANYQTIETWKAHLAELYANGNPLIIEYATASVPEPIDISAYLTDDNFIEVEGGGVIRAVNDYNHDAPTTISFVSAIGG